MSDSSEISSDQLSHKLMPWLVCFSASLFFFYEFIQGNMFASINNEIMAAFNTDMLGTSWMSSMYYLANVVFLFPAGVVLDRYSTKKVILLSLMTCVLGTFLFSIADTYNFALACRFVTGIGSAFCFLSCFRLASRWFPPQRMALVTGLVVTFAMSGGMFAQGPLTNLVVEFGWRNALMLDGLLGMFIALIVYAFVKDNPKQRMPHLKNASLDISHTFIQSLKLAYGNMQNILAGLYTSLMNMPVAILGAFVGSVYLMQSHHYQRFEAANINSMIFLGTIIGGPLIGFLSDKIQLRKSPMIVCTLLSMFIVVMILYVPNVSVLQMEILFFLLGLFSSAQVLSYPLVAENNCLSMTATAVSVVSVLTQGGFILYQNLFSYLLEHEEAVVYTTSHLAIHSTTAYRHALMLIPYGFILAFLAVFLLRETFGKRIEER